MPEPVVWKHLTPEEARAHRGYGLRGWLGLLEAANLVLLVVTLMGALSLWTNGAAPAELSGETAPLWALRGLMTLTAGALLLVAVFLRFKRPWSPMAIIASLAGMEGATLMYDAIWPTGGLVGFLLSHALSVAVIFGLARWLLRGFGPNLTYRRRVRVHAA